MEQGEVGIQKVAFCWKMGLSQLVEVLESSIIEAEGKNKGNHGTGDLQNFRKIDETTGRYLTPVGLEMTIQQWLKQPDCEQRKA